MIHVLGLQAQIDIDFLLLVVNSISGRAFSARFELHGHIELAILSILLYKPVAGLL